MRKENAREKKQKKKEKRFGEVERCRAPSNAGDRKGRRVEKNRSK